MRAIITQQFAAQFTLPYILSDEFQLNSVDSVELIFPVTMVGKTAGLNVDIYVA